LNFSGAKLFIEQRLKEEIPLKFAYHNIDHIMDVYYAAERIAKEEGLGDDEIQILLIAVLFHDSGFILDRVDHEALSCKIASENLPGFGFSSNQINMILGLIRATKIPQNPSNLLEKIICDADLDYLGREDFWEIGNKLFEELKTLGLISNKYEWNQNQLVFLENHSYFTNASQKLRNERKHQNLLEIKARLVV